MLNARELKVFYGVIQGLKGVDIDVYDREIVTLIGSNGAGKTSTLNGIVNLVRSSGRVSFLNDDISRSQTHQIVRRGLALVPEGRRVFTNLTIEENLRMGAYNNLAGYARLRDRMYALFPRLKERRHQMAGTMSGGEQQHTQRQCDFCGFIAHSFSPESLFCFVDITLPQIARRRQRRKNSYL